MAARGADDGHGHNEERHALELELAAALAELSAQDVGLDEHLEHLEDVRDQSVVEEDYVRLDLDAVLQSEAERNGAEDATIATAPLASTWTLLLQTVARSEREFFGPMKDELAAIQVSILAPKPPQSSTEKLEVTERPHSRQQELQDRVSRELEAPRQQKPSSNEQLAAIDQSAALESAPVASKAHTEAQLKPEQSVSSLPFEAEHEPKEAVETPQAEREEERRAEAELRCIATQHAAREARRSKALEQQRKTRQETEKLLLQLQEDFDNHERKVEAVRREADEGVGMADEELRGRLYAAAEREAHELGLLALEDEFSRRVEVELARVNSSMEVEMAQMQAEEQAARRRLRMEQQLRRQEELGRSRCRFGAVVLELHEKFASQRRRREQEKKRERREGVLMRGEEAQQRRIVAQERLVREHKTRSRERAALAHEDTVARAMEALEREHVDQGRSCVAMRLEDERSGLVRTYLAAQALEAERRRQVQQQRWKDNVVLGLDGLTRVSRRRGVACGWAKWQNWHRQRLEAEQARAAAEEDAARKLQTWMRSLRRRLEALTRAARPSEEHDHVQVDEEEEDATAESHEAARRVQSTFRGFHVRHKFANALALAQAVEADTLDAFDAVDLEDLIQLPPELDEGWETPVLPTVSTSIHTRNDQQLERWDDAASLEDEAMEQEDGGGLDTSEAADRPEEDIPVEIEAASRVSKEGAAPAKETNLAATLWSKMRRVKQRQQHAKEERQRQQDPTYRVQKLLHRQPSRRSGASTNNNQNNHSHPQTSQGALNTVTWSSNSKAKKRPKVKLPSLVERLRKQTLAAR